MNTTSRDNAHLNVDPDILRSDPEQRRKLQWLIAAAIATVLLLLLFGVFTLKHATDTHDTRALGRQLEMVFYGLSALLLVTAAYAGWHARRIFGSSQYPPPGSWVLRDTRLLRGDRARGRGWWALVCAAVSLLLAVYAASLPRQIERTLQPPPVHHPLQIATRHG
jgi:TRAP-type C4-dicarboxylate transport system permease small subunit